MRELIYLSIYSDWYIAAYILDRNTYRLQVMLFHNDFCSLCPNQKQQSETGEKIALVRKKNIVNV